MIDNSMARSLVSTAIMIDIVKSKAGESYTDIVSQPIHKIPSESFKVITHEYIITIEHASMASFDKIGTFMPHQSNSIQGKSFSYATIVWNDEGYVQGIYMVRNLLVIVCARHYNAKLYRGGQEIFKSIYYPLKTYIQS